eukprot:788644-Prymnesium_polylepis.1
MDVIIDDGDHSPSSMEATLRVCASVPSVPAARARPVQLLMSHAAPHGTAQVMWPYLRVGGYYIIEDVATGANRGPRLNYNSRRTYPPGFSPLIHNTSLVSEVHAAAAQNRKGTRLAVPCPLCATALHAHTPH